MVVENLKDLRGKICRGLLGELDSTRKNLLVFTVIFAGALALCFVFRRADGIEGYASPVFVLTVLLISRFTTGYLYGLAASVLGVICVNFFFTYPYMAVNFSIAGYPLTFFSLLVVSLITSALTTKVKNQEELKLENEREKVRSDLLRSISHDIRTPLTSIIGAADALLDPAGLDDKDARMMLQDIRNEAKWLLRMVENLLSVTKVSSNTIKGKELWAVEEIIADAVRKVSHSYPAAEVEVVVPDEALFVPMDPLLIEQVLINLMENALIHGGSTSVVTVKAWSEKDRAVFSVTDDGDGFPDRLLKGFDKGDFPVGMSSDTDGHRSTGLGLRVCRSIVAAHGGGMKISNQQKGASVSFYLPMEGE